MNQFKRFQIFQLEPGDRATVLSTIRDGSTPSRSYFVMTLVSTLIAASGLVSNSAAVIIGAMLVAPLMSPIFGIAMALLRGDTRLLVTSLRSECYGALFAIFLGFLFGLLPLSLDLTNEMLSRTRPSIIDLLVAVLAGMAGGYAMVDKRVSATLPGVAIATAIVPPLANCGLCLAMGVYHGALGSFLLFLANLISILLVASVMFYMAGFTRFRDHPSPTVLAKRFGMAMVGFVSLSIYLTYTLFVIVQDRRIESETKDALSNMLAEQHDTQLDNLKIYWMGDIMVVQADVMTSSFIPPVQVHRMQDALEKYWNREVTLSLRNIQARRVSASYDSIFDATQDDSKQQQPPAIPLSRQAEQVMLDLTQHMRGVRVRQVTWEKRLYTEAEGEVIMADIASARPIYEEDVLTWETELRKRLDRPKLNLGVIYTQARLMTGAGEYLFGFSDNNKQSIEAYRNRLEDYKRVLEPVALNRGYVLDRVFLDQASSPPQLLVELLGSQMPDTEDRNALSSLVQDAEVLVRYKSDLVLTPKGAQSYRSVRNVNTQKIGEAETEDLKKLKAKPIIAEPSKSTKKSSAKEPAESEKPPEAPTEVAPEDQTSTGNPQE